MSSGNRLRYVAVLALLGASVLWGTSFATVKTCSEVLQNGAGREVNPAFGPLLLTALRFTFALPIVLIFWRGRESWSRLRRQNLPDLLKVALPMTAGFIVQAIGLAYTTAVISAFLTSLAVLLIPLLEWLVFDKRTTWRLAVAIALAIGATAMLTLPGGARESSAFGLGEVLTLICVAGFSFQVLWTGKGAERIGSGMLTFGSFACAAGVSWVGVALCWPTQIPGALWAAATSPTFLWYFALVVLGATVLASGMMNAFQRYLRPTEAAIIYTTEPLFATVFAWMIRGRSEFLGAWGLAGAGLMLAADFLAAANFSRSPRPADASARAVPADYAKSRLDREGYPTGMT